nr:MAG TPA: hypothetical protein [Caudoviricetes sp.]
MERVETCFLDNKIGLSWLVDTSTIGLIFRL